MTTDDSVTHTTATATTTAWTGLSDSLVSVLTGPLAFPEPTPIQTACIAEIVANDRDYLVKAPTGSGKTLALLLPLLRHCLASHTSREQGTLILLLSPTRELATQTHKLLERVLSRLRPHWMTSLLLCGGQCAGDKVREEESHEAPGTSRKREKEALRRGQTVVVGSPGRVLDHLQNSSGWKRASLQWVVLDEADRLMDAGFAPKVKEIVALVSGNPDGRAHRPAIVYCSATLSDCSGAFVELRAGSKLVTCNDTGSMPSTLKQQALICPTKHRLALLTTLFKARSDRRSVVFMSNCDSVDYHYVLFKQRIVPESPLHPDDVFKLHGNLEQTVRTAMLTAFSQNERAVLFCTDVAARGLNLGGALEGVRLIVQYDAPSDRLDYVHRAGRTARGMAAIGRNVLMLHECEHEYLGLLKSLHAIDICEQLDATAALAWLHEASGRSRFGLWLKKLSTAVGKDPEVSALAHRAYSSSIRAYATHASDERHIFHIKRLHLGHLAASFGLDEHGTEKDGRSVKGKDGRVSNGKDGKVFNGKDGKVFNGKDEKSVHGKDGKSVKGKATGTKHNVERAASRAIPSKNPRTRATSTPSNKKRRVFSEFSAY